VKPLHSNGLPISNKEAHTVKSSAAPELKVT
jgi:hypothetical protein